MSLTRLYRIKTRQAAELRKWKEKAESLTLQLKARDAEVRGKMEW